MELRKNVSPEFVLGTGALAMAGRYALNFGAQRAFVVTDPGVLAAGWTGKVVEALAAVNIPCVIFSEVTPNPQDVEVMQGAKHFLESGCDIIISVGGGSPTDCAKGIGAVASGGQHILTYEGVDKVHVPGPPLICIPTTAGASADVSQFAIINDTQRHVKIAIISKAMVPDVSLIDPQTTLTMSPELTAATGVDALVHAIESYVSTASSPVTDLWALEAIRLISSNLALAVSNPGEIRYRDSMMLGSLLAGLAFSNASLGLVHAMAHSLGGLLDLPHGECNALLLEHVLDFNHAGAVARYAAVAEAFGLDVRDDSPSEQKSRLVEALHAFRRSVGLGHGLEAIGVKHADIAQLARYAQADPCVVTNPIQPSIEDIAQIYERAFESR